VALLATSLLAQQSNDDKAIYKAP